MIKKTLFSAGFAERDPFRIFDKVERVVSPDELHTNGMLILWGGEDISPSLYGQAVVGARAPSNPSNRDKMEKALFEKAVELGIPVIGVCRGAQLACALSGGTLFQHIEGGHHGDHLIETKDGAILETSSCHHQALNLAKVDHELLAWDKDREVRVFTDLDTFKTVIPEVAILNKTKTLAIQGHPEWMSYNSPFNKWLSNILMEKFA